MLMFCSVHIYFLLLLPSLSPLQLPCVLWFVCFLWPGLWSSMLVHALSSDQDTYK